MGSKIKIFAISSIAVLVMMNMPCFAQIMPQIPASTLQAAREAAISQNAPSSEVVRVGIGTQNFGTYQYKEITVFGTGDTQIYDNRLLIGNYAPNQEIKISLKDGKFNIYAGGNMFPETVEGPVQITSNFGLLGVSGLKRAGRQALYHGAFELVKNNNGTFNLVNMIEVEDYLKGVVPNEMPVHFGLEALKAQSVAARNYVLSPRTKSSPNYDVVDSVASQVYYGANSEKTLSNQAVEETEGIVAIYNWDLILAQYSSTAGGYTESYANAFSDPKTKEFPSDDKPYLQARPDIIGQSPLNTEEAASQYYKSKPDAYDVRSPYFRWEREWSADELKKALEVTLAAQSSTGFVKPVFKKGDKLDDIQEIKVLRRGDSGKIIEMEIVTRSQTFKVFKELVVRRLMTKDGKALPSANVVFENTRDENGNLVSVHAWGGGFGHGVGLSQYGAGFMGSEMHIPYDKILQHYYTGITLSTKPVIISADNSQQSVTQHFYAKNKYAKIIVDNKFMVSKLIANINGKEFIFELEPNILKRNAEIDISKYITKGKNTVIFYYPMDEGDKKALRLYVELVKKGELSFW
ncbi:spoIID/LytB domain protein [Fusobacterium sp. CAG:439]|nr:spoIID/LytB domain protein [Fusobacterium sp. CAG:439]HIT93024.1 SpoIID/LytB domain-containing protein [Candidatus Stercorousia faecigallinarum]